MHRYIVVAVLVGFVRVCCAEEFKVECPMPFADETHWDLNKVVDCGLEGAPQGSDANHAQNRMKNNFCATGQPVSITFNTVDKLQAAVDQKGIPYGSGQHLPPDRAQLSSLVSVHGKLIGEGSVVRIVAYIIDAHYSNVRNGESVNCKLLGEDNNDIHIMLGWTVGDDPCETVTAEMIPHFRPDSWTADNLGALNGRLVRITGQLFFDGSHRPCHNGKPANPPRRSTWEIHPVYAIDVAKSRGSMRVSPSDNSNWMPMDEYVKGQPAEETE